MGEFDLARLLGRARGRGVDLATLDALAEAASARGAEVALARLGLADERAQGDLIELRELLGAWRDAKRTARNEVVGWLVRILLQFGRAVPLGGARWTLSRLLRGRRGTEWAMSTHQVGERFVLIEPEALVALELPAGAIGGAARLMASGLGDTAPMLADCPIAGVSVRPPSPVGLVARPLAAGDLALRWTRRSRAGWRWIDGVDAPLGEEREAYRLTVARDGVTVRDIAVAHASFDYSATMIAADAGGASALDVEVMQVGSWAASLPARLTLTL